MEEHWMYSAKCKSQHEKSTHSMNPTVWHSGRDRTIDTVEISVFASGWGGLPGVEGWISEAQMILGTVKLLDLIM